MSHVINIDLVVRGGTGRSEGRTLRSRSGVLNEREIQIERSHRAKPITTNTSRLSYTSLGYLLTCSSFFPSRLLWTHFHQRNISDYLGKSITVVPFRAAPLICTFYSFLSAPHLHIILHLTTSSLAPHHTPHLRHPRYSSSLPLLSDWATQVRRPRLVI